MPMCLLNMTDAQSGVLGLNLVSECSCQGAAPVPTPSPGRDPVGQPPATSLPTNHSPTPATMVVDLSSVFIPTGDRGVSQGMTRVPACGCGRPLPQLAFLPVRITGSSNNSVEVLGGVTVGPSTPTLPLLTVAQGGMGTGGRNGTHCACCRFSHRDSGFSEEGSCDSAFNLTTKSSQQQWTNNRQPESSSHQYYNNNKVFGSGDQESSSLVGECAKCKFNMSSQNDIMRHKHNNMLSQRLGSCQCNRLEGSSFKSATFGGNYENVSLQQRPKAASIPRIVCHSPTVGDSALSSVDSGISSPTLSDPQSLNSSGGGLSLTVKPDLQHSRSLQEDDLSSNHHHRQCQMAMAGGHLSILQAPDALQLGASRQHRHSTGSVLENIQNELNSIKCHPPVERSSSMVPATSSSQSEQGAIRVMDDQMSHHTASAFRPEVPVRNRVDNPEEMSSTSMNALTGFSFDSSSDWRTGSGDFSSGIDDPWGSFGDAIWVEQRSNSPSGGESSGDSTGDCSGSTVASWAQQFTGAQENAHEWKALKLSTKRLGKCGFYYEHMSMEQAKLMLKSMSVGSFLLRDSSNKKYLFSLSAKTPRGVTSVRIEYRNALFRLDTDEKSQSQMPGFDCVLKLIQYYVKLSEDKRAKKCVWLESSGRKDTPVLLTRPATQGVHSLMHLCRKVIHKTVPMEKLTQNLKTDHTLLQYLREYPYYV